jgi:uncharacterized repeat protein (TIGR02543 family)
MKLSFKTILPILLIFTLLILFTGCFITPSPEYTPPTYTVTYNGNTNTSGVVSTDANHYEQGALVMVLAPGSLVKTGYTFNVWNTAANGSGISQAAGSTFIMGPANVTLYAQWTANPTYTLPTYTPSTYTVTTAVDPASSGTVTGAGTYNAGTVVTITANPASGYQFVNWTGAVIGSVNPTTVTIDADKTVTANFAEILPDQYTLAVNTVGSGSVTKSPDQATYLSGTVVTLDPEAAAGWTFTGWSGGDLSGSTDPADITMNSNKSVTANFTQNEYTLTVLISPAAAETAGCAVNRNDAGSYNYGDVVQLTSNAVAGWTFSHWEGNLTGTNDPKDITIDGDKTVTANFVPTYTVTYNGNTSTGGVVPTDANHYEQSVSVTVLANSGSLVKTGYTFNGWNTAANGSGGANQAAGSSFIMGTANVTLYAQWTINTYTVAFDSQGGSAVDSQTVPHDGKVTKPTDPTKPGYAFAGWYKEPGYTNPWVFDADTVTANVTLYAKWTRTYNITFNKNSSGATGTMAKQTIASGSSANLTANAFIRTGWTFAGWAKTSGGAVEYADQASYTMGTANVTLFAKWTHTSP